MSGRVIPFALLLALASCDGAPTAPTPAPPSVVDFGAIPDDGKDDSRAFQDALARGGEVFVPEGEFDIFKTVYLTSNTRLFGGNNSRIRLHQRTQVAFRVRGYAPFSGKNVVLDNLSFEGTPGRHSFALALAQAESVTVRNNRVRGMALLWTQAKKWPNSEDGTPDPSATAGITSEEHLTRSVRVEGNSIDGLQGWGKWTEYGIVLNFAKDVVVHNNVIRNTWTGIQWWGGDGDSQRGGAWELNNPRWARNLVISGNDVRSTQAAIWGTMGQDVEVVDNRVAECSDVCLDAEASHRVRFARNEARNAVASVLAVFATSRDIVFEDNYVETDGSLGRTLFHSWNHTQMPLDVTIRVRRNRLVYTGRQGFGMVSKESSESFDLEDNTLQNTVIWTDENNAGTVRILRNRIQLDRPVGAAAAIAIGSNHGAWGKSGYQARVQNNKIIFSAPCGLIYGIRARQWNPAADVQTDIVGNEIVGFPVSIMVAGHHRVMSFQIDQNSRTGSILSEGSPPPKLVLGKNPQVTSLEPPLRYRHHCLPRIYPQAGSHQGPPLARSPASGPRRGWQPRPPVLE
jgi:hypothetical protein